MDVGYCPEALRVSLDLYRKMEPAERLARIFELCDFQQSLQWGDARAAHSEASEREVFLHCAARRLGRDLMIEAYPWDPDQHR